MLIRIHSTVAFTHFYEEKCHWKQPISSNKDGLCCKYMRLYECNWQGAKSVTEAFQTRANSHETKYSDFNFVKFRGRSALQIRLFVRNF